MPPFQQGHALIIGLGASSDPRLHVPVATRDAQACHAALIDPQGAGYPRNQTELLTDAQATRTGIINAFTRLAQRCTAESIVFISLTSHGLYGTDSLYYLVTSDTQLTNDPEPRIQPYTGFSVADLSRALDNLPAHHVLILVNACFAGQLDAVNIHSRAFPAEATSLLLHTDQGRAIICASQADQCSYFMPDADYSYFGQAVVQALKGEPASEHNGFIEVHQLFSTISRQVKTATAGRQMPSLNLAQTGATFSVAAYSGTRSASNHKPGMPVVNIDGSNTGSIETGHIVGGNLIINNISIANQSKGESAQRSDQLLKALKHRRFDEIDSLIDVNTYSRDFKESDTSFMHFLADLHRYKNCKLNPVLHKLSVDCNIKYLNESLIYLSYLGLLDHISREDVQSLLEANSGGKYLEGQFVAYLSNRQQIAEPSLPPDYVQDESIYLQPLKLMVPAILPQDFKLYLSMKPDNKIILVTGAKGSGRTTILELMQKVSRRKSALYPSPLGAAQLANDPLRAISQAIIDALYQLLNKNPSLWTYINEQAERSRAVPGQIIDLVGEGSTLHNLRLLSDQMAALKLTNICIAIDDAPSDFEYPLLHLQLQQHIRQKVFFRVVLRELLPYSVSIPHLHLDWSSDKLGELLQAIREEGRQAWAPGWTPEVGPERLLALVKTPRDLIVWVYALEMCYHGNDLSESDWQALQQAMQQAREQYRSGATDWQIEDAEVAQRVLKQHDRY